MTIIVPRLRTSTSRVRAPAEQSEILHATEQPFEHRPLISPNSVRFLQLKPSDNDTDVPECQFIDRPLSSNPEYEVLSGFWGDEEDALQPLIIEGRTLMASCKLAEALVKFRHQDRARLLWIQSACVDSRNTAERNSQMGQLRCILQQAQRLLIWLGPAADDSDLVFERLSHLTHSIENSPSLSLTDPPFGRETSSLSKGNNKVPPPLPPYTEDTATAFTKFCQRPWFYRPWSIPELALSKNILLFCGNHQFPLQETPWSSPLTHVIRAHGAERPSWASSDRASLFGDLDLPDMDGNPDAVEHLSSLCFRHHRLVYAETKDFAMEDVYRLVRNCRATDRRDSVFAIAVLESAPPVKIDYGLSVPEVYQQATWCLVRCRHHSIQVLRRLASRSRSLDLPSWTLDFSTPLATTGAIWILPGARFLNRFDGGTGYGLEEEDAYRRGLWPWDSGIQFRFEPGKLIITGRLMQRIAAIGPPMLDDVAADPTSRVFADTLAAWELLAIQIQPNKRFPQSLSDAFFDTIIANDTYDVWRNNPPRPLVSSVAGRAERWYRRHGAGVLKRFDEEYFAAAGQTQTTSTQPDATINSSHTGSPELYQVLGPDLHESDTRGDDNRRYQEFASRAARACANKRFFITDGGTIGLAPIEAHEGDIIAFFPSGKFPLFLREQPVSGKGSGAVYRLLGEGFMYDWWRDLGPVLEHRMKEGNYGDWVTEFVMV